MIKSYIPKRLIVSKIKQNIRSKILSFSISKIFKKNRQKTNEKINILEFGPGYGDLAKELVNTFNVKNYYFIDHSQENLEHIRDNIKIKNVHCICHDANHLISNVLEENFDIVISSHVIEHLKEPEKHLKDFSNLMSINGLGLISTPNLDSIDAINLGMNWRGYKDETHISLMSYKELEKLILDKNLEICLSGTSPNSLMELLYQKRLNSIFFSNFHLGDSSNFIFKKTNV